MEVLIIILIVIFIKNYTKKKAGAAPQKSAGSRYTPQPARPAAPSAQAVQQTVNQHLFGQSSGPRDKYSRYKRFITQDRYTDLKKLAHELDISKYQAVRDIRDLQEQGYFKDVTIDEKNYKLIYASQKTFIPRSEPPKKKASHPGNHQSEVQPAPMPEAEPERSFIEVSKPYQPARNAALRYEEWMPLPQGTHAVKCGYCGALNAVPNNHHARCTCYFCREDL